MYVLRLRVLMASPSEDGSESVEDPDVGFQTVMSPTTEEQTGDGVPDVSSLAYTYVFSTTDVVKLRSANLGWVPVCRRHT